MDFKVICFSRVSEMWNSLGQDGGEVKTSGTDLWGYFCFKYLLETLPSE